MDTSSGAGGGNATGNGASVLYQVFFICIGLKAVTDGVLRGAGDVVVFTLPTWCNLASGYPAPSCWLPRLAWQPYGMPSPLAGR